ncbi:hypothetical protein GCM10009733_019850 [Nonomuraea maheshkhaliensis]|uniref:DUF4367 domain-containing protein n=1 Tax=Nonomuraea maheshkhaliensis TaxID=419590 RepID=A0ABN2EZ40_9ACTN
MNSREPFDDLEAELVALGDLLDAPTPPPTDVAAAVRARLEERHPAATDLADLDASADPGPDPAHGPIALPVRPSRTGSRALGRRGRRWVVVAAVVVAVATVTAATPQGRAAVAYILRFAGIELRIGDTPPPPVTTTAGLPGEHTVPPSAVAGQARFPVRTPSALASPQRVTVSDGGRVVSMFWPDGIRLDQFDGAMDPYFFKKLGPPYPDHAVVGGRDAWWLPGAHPLGYIRRQDGTEVPLRQAAPTLVWQQGTLNYRLEGARSKEEAVRVAESLG